MRSLDHQRVLLVHPLGYSTGNADQDISRTANIMPPIGLCSISSYLASKGVSSDIVDLNAIPDSTDHIRYILNTDRPAYIGFSCTTASFFDGVMLAQFAKSVLPEVSVIFGGVHVSSLGDEMIRKHTVIDYIVMGEGEETLSELIESRGEAKKVPGLIYRDQVSGEIVSTGRRPQTLDLDMLPFPAYEKLEGYPHRYTLPIFNYPKSPNTSALTSRGCLYSCSYCDRSVFQKSYRYNSAGYIYDHMRYLRQRFGIRHINFYDDQFTLNTQRIDELTDMLINKPLGMTFNCAARAEHLNEMLLQRLKTAGCWMIGLGIETGDHELLCSLNRKANMDLLAECVHLIKNAGIRVKGLLMMGLPGETEESVEKTKKFLFSLPVDDFNLTKFTPFPGAPVYKKIREFGEFNEDWPRMDCMHFLFIPKGFSLKRLEELYMSFYTYHFKRPRVLLGYFAMLWRSPDSWKRFILNFFSFIRFAYSGKRFSGEKKGIPAE